MQGRHDSALAKGWQRIARFEFPSSEVSANKPKLAHLSADLFMALLRQTGSRCPSPPPPFQRLPRAFSQVGSHRQQSRVLLELLCAQELRPLRMHTFLMEAF